MDRDEAADQLERAHSVRRLSARGGAWIATIVASVAVLGIGVVADLDMWWLSGLVILGVAGVWAARPLRSRFDWSNRVGVGLFLGGSILALAAYILVQFPVRAAGWSMPNTIGAVVAIIVILVLCRAGLVRMALSSNVTERSR